VAHARGLVGATLLKRLKSRTPETIMAQMRILFVCSGNAYRSPVAEALLRKLKPDIEVDSAGTSPAIPVSESAKMFVERESASKYLKSAPEGLAAKDLPAYDLIIAMKPEHKEVILSRCPQCLDKIVVWNVDDPYFLPHGYAEKIFNQIMDLVRELASSL
jgi:protein-tyrosine-phosphatase